MRRPQIGASRASDIVLGLVVVLAILALLPLGMISDVALDVLAATLIAWPLGMLVWLGRRWARAGDLRFVLLAMALAITATGSAVVAITASG